MENNTVANVKGNSIVTNTPEGAAYVRKVTHPPSGLEPLFKGRPDCSQPNIVLMELKSEVNISPSCRIATSTSTTQTFNPRDILFLQTSGPFTATYPFYKVAVNGTTYWTQCVGQSAISGAQPALNQTNPIAVINQGYNASNMSSDVASFRSSYKSSTYYLNATAFNDQGMVTTAKFKPNVVLSSLADEYTRVKNHKPSHDNLKRAHDALTKHQKQIINQEEFEEIGGPTILTVTQFLDVGRGATGESLFLTYNSSTFNNFLPLVSSELITFSPKAASRPAKEGAFVVQQNIDPVSTWSSMNCAKGPNAGPSQKGLLQSFFRFYNTTTNTYHYTPLYSDYTGTVSSLDAPWNNLDFAFTLFEGLTIPINSDSGLPYITTKNFYGMELQVTEDSSLRPFQSMLPLPDSKAIEMVCGIFHCRPDSLPASANDWGTIGKVILQALPVAANWLLNSFSGKKNKIEKQPVKKNPVSSNQTEVKLEKKIEAMNNNYNRLMTKMTQLTMSPAMPSGISSKPRQNKRRYKPNKNMSNQNIPLAQYLKNKK